MKHFDPSFAHDSPRIWNDVPDDVCSDKSLFSFRRKLKTYLFAKASTLFFSGLVSIFLCGVDPCNVSDLMNTISDFWHYASYSLSIDGD